MNRLKISNSNILAVIRSDFLHLSKSIVSIVCVFCIALVPCLYSWFNIISNWSPYTPDATQNVPVAILSIDKGAEALGEHFDVGNVIIERLKSNNQLDWQFPETQTEMLDGLYNGDYYAAMLIPEDFSENVLGFTDGEVEDAQILYYENQKKNAVASKVTDRARSFVEDEVNAVFVSSIVDELSAFTTLFSGVGIDAIESLDSLNEQLEDIRTDLKAYSSILESMATITQSAATVTQMTSDLLPDIIDLLNNSRTTISNMQERLVNGKQDVIYASDAIRTSSEEIRNTIERLDENTNGDPAEAASSVIDWDALYGEAGISQYEGEILDDLYYDVNKELHDSAIAFDDILQQTDIDSNLVASISTLQDSLNNLDSLIIRVTGDVSSTSLTLSQFTSSLQACTDTINGTRDVMSYMLNMVDTLQDTVNTLRENESFTKVVDLLNNDVDGLVEYLASPASVQMVRVYSTETFGSGMAPFYTCLSLYASALLCASFINSHVKRKGELAGLNTVESYLGRLILFFIIGQFTALITTLGVLYYIGIQCYNPFLFWLTAAITSLLFTIINYGLVYSLSNIGEALSIVILVIQVAGSGGTYPLQLLPEFFSKLHRFMPFNYAMNAMRETIHGMYDHVYIKCILVLLLMIAICLPLFLIIYKFTKPLLHYFDKSKAETKIMHAG